MFFRLLGQIIRRAWAPLLAVWALLLLGTHFASPAFNDVARDRRFAFLPADAPSRVAEKVFSRAFPDDHFSSNIVLVVHRAEGARAQRERDQKFIEDVLEPALWQIAQDEGGLAGQPGPSDEPLFADD